jgi:hypothetical protein
LVNLDKWEEIEFADIRAGDFIRVITVGKRCDFEAVTDARGTVTGQTWGDDWSCNGINLAKKPGSKGPDFLDTFYRRKPKPFVFPENAGAVIKATHKETESTYTYVWTGEDWTVFGSSLLSSDTDFLRKNYKDFVLISEGVKLD